MSVDHNRKQSKENYRKVVRTVYHQTSKAQPPLSELHQILTTATSPNGMSTKEVKSKLKVGVEEKKHLVCINGRIGVRFDEDRIRRIITYVVENNLGNVVEENGNTKNELIAELNEIKQNVSGINFDHLKYKTED